LFIGVYDSTVLDHFGIVDRELKLYIAVGCDHGPNHVVAYLKYVPSTSPSLWRSRYCYYHRVLARYSPTHVEEVSRSQSTIYDPFMGIHVPIVPKDRIARIVDPRHALRRVLHSCSDDLECLAVQLVDDLRSHGLELSCLGIAGSIMFGIHNPRISDIDLVIYGDRCVSKAVEVAKNVLDPLPSSRLRTVVENLAKLSNVDLRIAELVHVAIPRRGMYRGREVTVVFSRDRPLDLRKLVVGSRCVELTIEVEPGDPEALTYPSRFSARVGNEVLEVVSYDAAYGHAAYLGGKFRVSGVLQILDDGSKRLVLGVRECNNYLGWA